VQPSFDGTGGERISRGDHERGGVLESGGDVVVVGAGIVGLATALALTERGAEVVVVDKEPQLAVHQTGHNSGVIHTGVYYRPGSAKARLCVEGRRRLIAFCDQANIPTRISGKVIVAVDEDELPRLDELQRRASANGVEAHRIGPDELADLEPYARGIAALHVPGAGVVDFRRVAAALAEILRSRNTRFVMGAPVVGADRRSDGVRLRLADGTSVGGSVAVACAGLQSDRVAAALGLEPSVRIVPFRGEYWHLRRPELVRGLIYPVPDPAFPFLGVHFTKKLAGEVEVGPNAVPALAREGYSWGRVSLSDTLDVLRTPGLAALVRRYWRTGLAEILRSLWPPLLLKAARRLLPALLPGDLVRAGAGVRAQALAPDGSLVDDFVFAQDDRVVAVLNAPSPAATASLAIGEEIARRVPV
jgi:L-2-hydroxyglutarate oxidase